MIASGWYGNVFLTLVKKLHFPLDTNAIRCRMEIPKSTELHPYGKSEKAESLYEGYAVRFDEEYWYDEGK